MSIICINCGAKYSPDTEEDICLWCKGQLKEGFEDFISNIAENILKDNKNKILTKDSIVRKLRWLIHTVEKDSL